MSRAHCSHEKEKGGTCTEGAAHERGEGALAESLRGALVTVVV